MASVQCHKPSDQVHHTTRYEKSTTTEVTCQHNTQHHSFTDKMKEMANSARKVFNHQEQHGGPHHGSNNGHHVSDHTKKPVCGSNGTRAGAGAGAGAAHDGLKKKNKVKKTEGHGGHCMPKMHKKKHKEEKHGGSSDSGSSSESENETCKKH